MSVPSGMLRQNGLAIDAGVRDGDVMASQEAHPNSHDRWITELGDMVRGPQGNRLGVPRHVLERIGALIGDDAQIDWVESTVRYARKEEGEGLAGMLAIFGQRLLVVVTLQNVREHRWRGARDDDGAVDARLIRRSDLARIEVPASTGYDNGPDAWGDESDGSWRYRTSIELVYRDGTRIELGGDQSGDVFVLLPSLRDDLLM
ncbi:hypothetical protein [Nocardioides sp. T2.26MG-1]|uniref:hypothetical protein n=1 Tax=Nocardioides sp. T2.26MG-1 TaxID=3041166 RepID=UPI0025414BC5|nr:hypothetical protein [Nocardioides sp. T2.26MG-1]